MADVISSVGALFCVNDYCDVEDRIFSVFFFLGCVSCICAFWTILKLLKIRVRQPFIFSLAPTTKASRWEKFGSFVTSLIIEYNN